MEITGPEPYFLYRATGDAGDLLYVGVCANVRLRIGQHAADKSWWPEVARVDTQMFDTKAQALAAERQAIESEHPKYNVTHSAINTPDPWVKRKRIGGTPAPGAYEVTVYREDRWWMVAIPELNGLTQARRVSEAALMAREYIAVTLDLDLDDVAVDVRVESVGAVTNIEDRLAAIEAERAKAAELERQATAEASQLAKDLAAAKIPLRDVGTILGVSHQRAHQLVRS